jgi:hypothetical protein
MARVMAGGHGQFMEATSAKDHRCTHLHMNEATLRW